MSSASNNAGRHLPIDLSAEKLISLSQVARNMPPFRSCRPVNPSTVLRWIIKGARLSGGERVRLEALRLGGRWLTSMEAVGRFIAIQTDDRVGECEPAPRTSRQRRQATERARDELRRAGIAKAG
jgi:hypothetical protein